MFSDREFLRAIKNTVIFGIGGILLTMPCEIGLALIPVSYTHLDVYKRQLNVGAYHLLAVYADKRMQELE